MKFIKKGGIFCISFSLILQAGFFSWTALSAAQVEIAQAETVGAAAFANAEDAEVLVKYSDRENAEVLKFSSNEEAASVLSELRNDENVEYAQPNFIYSAAAEPSDPLTSFQRHLDIIRAREGWDIASSAENVVVAVIDSGVDIDHPDLKDNIWTNDRELFNRLDDDNNGYTDDFNGWDFLSDSNDVRPKFDPFTPENAIGIQHGTMVAGILGAAGNNSVGVSGIAWDIQIMPLRVLNQHGTGNSETVTKALDYAINAGVDIINLSLVGTDFDPLVVSLLNRAYEEGIIVVAAAGNNGVNLNASKTYPVCYNHVGAATVIGVGAVNDDFTRPGFSNYGDECVDIVAPGIKIFSTRYALPQFESLEQYAALYSGTSFATPQVTGVIALMKQINPSLTPDEVLDLLLEGATPIDSLHAAGTGFDFALNVQGTISLVEGDGLDPFAEVKEQIKNGKFYAYPLGEFSATAYQYQTPGPLLLSPLVFNDDYLAKGMRWVKQTPFTIMMTAWRQGAKKVMRYNFLTQSEDTLLEISPEDPQTAGDVAVGNVDFDKENEIVVSSAPFGRPLISIYTMEGALKSQFQPYDDGVNLGLDIDLIDTNGDLIMEIASVPYEQTSGNVKIFEYTGLTIAEWNAYGDAFNGGGSLSIADVNSDGQQEILVGPGANGGPHVRIFKPDGSLMQEFFAGNVSDSGGAHIEYFDFDGDNAAEYVITYKRGHDSVVRLYDSDGVFVRELGVLSPDYKGGVGVFKL